MVSSHRGPFAELVYTPLGVENIYQPNVSYAPESPYQQAGPATLADFNHQASGIVQERAHLPGRIVLQAGGRFADVSDFNYSNAALAVAAAVRGHATLRCAN